MSDEIIQHYPVHFDWFIGRCKARILKNLAQSLGKIKNSLDESPAARYSEDAS